MLSQLKRHAVMQLSLTIFLTMSFLMTFYYYFYNQILYKDYIAKATSLSEIYSQNTNSCLKQIDKNIATFANSFDIYASENTDTADFNLHLSDLLTNIMKYKYNVAIYDIAIILSTGESITRNNYFNMEVVKNTGMLETLSKQHSCVYYNPDTSFFTNSNNSCFLYGKTIYDSVGNPSFYIIEAINTDYFVNRIHEETYFTKNASVYIIFDNAYLTVTENDKTKLDPNLLTRNGNISKKRNIKTVSFHNTNYNIDVVTNFNANDKANFIGFLKNAFILLCSAIGILGLIFSKKIVEHIIRPLEKTYIKINKNAFR